MAGTGIIDQFLETFTRYIDSGFGLLGGEVGYLATTLAAIDVTLAGLFWAWGADEDILARLVRKTSVNRYRLATDALSASMRCNRRLTVTRRTAMTDRQPVERHHPITHNNAIHLPVRKRL